jgi:ubiquinone/menaquinone biosynthesis C-methylase UbiE
MAFHQDASAYDRYMGRHSRELAPQLITFAGVQTGMRVLDVGCGPGALSAQLAALVGQEHVAAADPSEPFVASCAERLPVADVRRAPAEALPWPDGVFDAVLSQLVINFVADPDAALREQRRVARPGGIVAACAWDYGDGMRMLRVFWDAALALDPRAPDEGRTMRLARERELRELWESAGLERVEAAPLEVETTYASFDDYWEPFTLGVGPGGAYCVSLDDERREALREECRHRLGDPSGPFRLTARAWAVRGLNPPR